MNPLIRYICIDRGATKFTRARPRIHLQLRTIIRMVEGGAGWERGLRVRVCARAYAGRPVFAPAQVLIPGPRRRDSNTFLKSSPAARANIFSIEGRSKIEEGRQWVLTGVVTQRDIPGVTINLNDILFRRSDRRLSIRPLLYISLRLSSKGAANSAMHVCAPRRYVQTCVPVRVPVRVRVRARVRVRVRLRVARQLVCVDRKRVVKKRVSTPGGRRTGTHGRSSRIARDTEGDGE
jgi:hypothetical protein